MNKLLNNFKTKNSKTILVFVLLLVLCAGISFAAYNYTNNASDNSLKSGQITMTYTEPSNTVILKDALPKEDELGKSQTEYFEFSVMSNATTNEDDDKGVKIPYEISLSKVAVDDSLKQLEDSQVKIYLTKLEGEKETKVLGPILISELDGSEYDQEALKIYDTKNHHKNNNGSITTKYRLRFWLDNNVDVSEWSTANEYAYKFKVNVNANSDYLDVANQNTLASKIKSMYTIENGAAALEDGYYYLKGVEEAKEGSGPTPTAFMYYGTLGHVYLYRQEKDNGNVQPTSKIKHIIDTKQYTYNQELLEHDIKNYFINGVGFTEEQYNQLVGPFGGYVNVVLGSIAGVVDMNSMTYVEGKTIKDIPSLDEVMENEGMRTLTIEMFSEIIPYAMMNGNDSFTKLYYQNEKINYELLTANLELGGTAIGIADMMDELVTNFGSLSNYCIAAANGLSDESGGVPKLIEGKTIEDIPTLESILLKEVTPFLKNTYVKLNNLLWEVMGINSDGTVKLSTLSYIRFSGRSGRRPLYEYFGYEMNEDSPFYYMLEGTTLKDLIVKKEYEYVKSGKKYKALSYVGLATYDEIMNSTTSTENNSYLFRGYEGYENYYTVADFDNGYRTFRYESTKYQFVDSYYYQAYIRPVITIRDIEVEGEGTKTNPYRLIGAEKTSKEENIIYSQVKTDLYYGIYNSELYPELGYDSHGKKSTESYFDDKIYASILSINDKCYYETIEGNRGVIDYDGNCYEKFVSINTQPTSNMTSHLFEEVIISVSATNVTKYQWQQKIGDQWIDLEDYEGRIKGSKTSILIINPTEQFDTTSYYRCVVEDGILKTSSVVTELQLVSTNNE